jgi:hypothetical protein
VKRTVSAFLTALLLTIVTAVRPSSGAVPGIAIYPPLTLEAPTNVDLRTRLATRVRAATRGRVQALPFPGGLAPDDLIHGLAENAKSNGFERFLVISTHPTGVAVIVDLALYDSGTEKRISGMSISAQAIGSDDALDLSALLPNGGAPIGAVTPPPNRSAIVDPEAVAAPPGPTRHGGLRGLIARLRPDRSKRMNLILLPFEGKSGDPLGVHATLTFVQELDAIDVGVRVVKGVEPSSAADDAICKTAHSDAIVTGTRTNGANGATTFGVNLHPCDPEKGMLPRGHAQSLRQHFEDNVAHNPSTDPVVNAVRRLIRGMLAS